MRTTGEALIKCPDSSDSSVLPDEMLERRRKEGGAGGDSVSRREARDGDRRRPRSRSERERESSPKRSRDGKTTLDRKYSGNHVWDTDDNRERKHRRRFQDALPVENSSVADTMMNSESQKDGSNRKVDPDISKRSSDPAEATGRRAFFQNNERGRDGHASRVSVHSSSDDGRSRAKAHTGEKVDKREASDMNTKYVRTKARAVHETEWKHDRFFELEAGATVPRRRPSFSEKKIPAEKDSLAAPPTGLESRHPHDQQIYGAARREEKVNYFPGDEPKRSFHRLDDKRGDRYIQINEMYRTDYQSQERHNFRERTGEERLGGRYGDKKSYQQSGLQVEKWKHDLYEEANRSPTPKNEEEQVAKIEALLSR